MHSTVKLNSHCNKRSLVIVQFISCLSFHLAQISLYPTEKSAADYIFLRDSQWKPSIHNLRCSLCCFCCHFWSELFWEMRTLRGHPCRRVHSTRTLKGKLDICHADPGCHVFIYLWKQGERHHIKEKDMSSKNSLVGTVFARKAILN